MYIHRYIEGEKKISAKYGNEPEQIVFIACRIFAHTHSFILYISSTVCVCVNLNACAFGSFGTICCTNNNYLQRSIDFCVVDITCVIMKEQQRDDDAAYIEPATYINAATLFCLLGVCVSVSHFLQPLSCVLEMRCWRRYHTY